MQNEENQFLEKICSHVQYRVYHTAIKKELRNHIRDSVDALTAQGMPEEAALCAALKNMGDPDELGKQLNKAYRPQFDRRMYKNIFLTLVLFLIFECLAVHGKIDFLTFAGPVILTILIGSSILFLFYRCCLFYSDRLHYFAMAGYFSMGAMCTLIVKMNAPYSRGTVNALLLLYPLIGCCFLDKVKSKKQLGLFLTVLVFLLPVFLSIYLQCYAGMTVLLLVGWCVLISAIYRDWFEISGRIAVCLLVSLPFAFFLLFFLHLKLQNILLNRTGFYIYEVIADAAFWGKGSFVPAVEHLIDYPLTLMISQYGYIFLVVYILFAIYVVYEGINVYRRKNSFIAQMIVVSILACIITETMLSIPVNLGIPLAKGIMVPFLDFKFGIAVKLFQLGIIGMTDCFGDYLFSNFTASKLFDIEDGKIIIYYKS